MVVACSRMLGGAGTGWEQEGRMHRDGGQVSCLQLSSSWKL